PQHVGGVNRCISFLAGRSFLVEIVLAIRAALHSGGVCRRLFAAVCCFPKDFDRYCAAFLCSPTCGSPERPAANVPSFAAGGDKRGSEAGISCGSHRNWRWNIPHAATAVLPLGA